MLLDMPPIDNVSTQIKQRMEVISCLTSTQVDDLPNKRDRSTTLDFTDFLNYQNSTQLFIKKEILTDHSTWLDFIEEDFDIISKIPYSKTFKVKAKIKTISRFTPKVIID